VKPEGENPDTITLGIYDCLAEGPCEEAAQDMWVFPNLITDKLCQDAPPALFLTCEFDSCRKAAEQGAAIYRRNENLLAFGMIGGCTHASYFNFENPGSDAWFNAVKRFFNKYL
jgi:hypothetical protein